MTQLRQTDNILIETVKGLHNKANEHYSHFDKENRESRKVEAFSILILLFEKVLTSFGLSLLEKREDLVKLYERRKEWYGIDNAISDIYLLGEISADEFSALKEFQKDRNDYTHRVFDKGSNQGIERYASSLFKKHQPTFKLIFKKLKEELAA